MTESTTKYLFIFQNSGSYIPFGQWLDNPPPDTFQTKATTYYKHLIQVAHHTFTYYLQEGINPYEVGGAQIVDWLTELEILNETKTSN